MQFNFFAPLLFAAISLPLPLVASPEGDRVLEYAERENIGLSEEDYLKKLCGPILRMSSSYLDIDDTPLPDPMFLPPSGIGTEPLCAIEAGINMVTATASAYNSEDRRDLGSAIVEDTANVVWFSYYNTDLLTFSFTNPYTVPTNALVVAFNENTCGSGDTSNQFEIAFDRKVEPDELVFIQLDAPTAGVWGETCMEVLDVKIEPLRQADRAVGQILTQARVGDWENAVLLAEVIQKSEFSLPGTLLSELKATIEAGVKPLPSSDAIKNHEGYRSLLALDPENPNFETRAERYRTPALDALTMIMIEEEVYGSLPFVISSMVYEALSSDKTRMQRDDYWSKAEGKVVSISGRVSDVKPSGMIFPATIEIDTADNNSAICFIKEELERAAMHVSKGSNISCTGILSSYTLILGHVGVNIEKGEFAK